MSTERTYLVTFWVHDCYSIRLAAMSEDDAVAKAQDLYEEEHEDAFELDISQGGTDDWHASEVHS
jgi:hypothetical protein